MAEELTNEELREMVRKRQEEIGNYRRERGERLAGKNSLVGMARHRKQKKKSDMKNKWEGPDKNYTKIPHQFIEAMSREYLRPNESIVVLFLIRKTWGWR